MDEAERDGYNGYKNAGGGVLIAAPKSGSGKTLISCAIIEALLMRGEKVRAFKCGPDYIDPMFHKKVLGVPSQNLDCFFSKKDRIRELYERDTKAGDIAVVEGVMGLYDGLGGTSEEASAYHVAKILKLPIVLVVDAHGMGRSVAALLAGFLQYDTEKLIRGVILNRVGKELCAGLAPVIEKELHIRVFGCFPEDKRIHLESRHLGLQLPEEIEDLEQQIKYAAAVLEENVAVEELCAMARETAEDVSGDRTADACAGGDHMADNPAEKVRIGVARDEAFCFYYEENLRLLEKAGAELVFFSPMHDRRLPEDLHGILLGGGYPELHAGKLADNLSMRDSVRDAILSGMPSMAECGGFMYLHRSLKDQKGDVYAMCGVLSADCEYKGRAVRFGYVEIAEKEPHFLAEGEKIRGHEFHYYDSSDPGSGCVAVKPVSGREWLCIHAGEDHWWGFPHLYYASAPGFVKHFVKAAINFKDKNCQIDKIMS